MPYDFRPTLRLRESEILRVSTFGEHKGIHDLDRYFDENMRPIDLDEYVRRVRAKPKEPYFIEHGILINGHPEVDHNLVPKQLCLSHRLAKLPKVWPHSADFGFTFMINSAIKNCIETFEPGVHEFYPVSIIRSPGDASPLDHPPCWLLNICNLIHGIDMTHGDTRWDEESWIFYQHRQWISRSNKMVFNERRIANRHLWREKGCKRWLICSDELKEALEGVGVNFNGLLSFGTINSDDPDV